MTIASFQPGTITLASGDTTGSDTLSTTVTQSNSILVFNVRGGNNVGQQSIVGVTLNGAGTSVSVSRNQSGVELTVEYQVIESTAFTCQHVSITHSGATTGNETITAVDLDYTFPINNGFNSTNSPGPQRGNNNLNELELTSTINLLSTLASSATREFYAVVVEMSATEIASIQLVQASPTTIAHDETITSVDPAKTLLFPTMSSSDGALVPSELIGSVSLTSSTNLRIDSYAASANQDYSIYVVEFNNLVVTNGSVDSANATETEVLGGAPTSGGALVNGTFTYSSADTTDDAMDEEQWAASLSGSTWTFTRDSNTVASKLRYSVFDWDDIFAAAVTAALTGTITASVDEDDITTGGETAILTLTGDTWVAAGATFDAQRQNIIDGFDAASSPTTGWNNEVRDKAAVTECVRTSDTVVTLTWAAQAGYDISAQEVVTPTIPATALVTSSSAVVATPTFTIDPVGAGIIPLISHHRRQLRQ